MKLYSATKAGCQALANKAHQFKIENDDGYAQSVKDGKTIRWSFPIQDNGWYVPIDPSLIEAFTEAELLGLDQEGKDFLKSLESDQWSGK